jgi:hypothetical protein
MTDRHPSHPRILDGGEAPDMCAICHFEGLDLEAACGDNEARDQLRKKQRQAFADALNESAINLADWSVKSLVDRPELHSRFKQRLVDRFERQTGKRWHEVKLPREATP